MVCTDCPVGGARMHIRDGRNGYLIPVGDADVMADRMLALMEDKKLGESFSKESVKIREGRYFIVIRYVYFCRINPKICYC